MKCGGNNTLLFFLKGKHRYTQPLSTSWVPPSGAQRPPANTQPPLVSGLTVTVPPPHLGSSRPSQSRGSDFLMQGIAGLPWLTQDLPASPCCFPEGYARGKGGEDEEKVGLLRTKWGQPPRGGNQGVGPDCAGFESNLYSLPASPEPQFLHL